MFQNYSLAELLSLIKKDLRADSQLVFDCDGTLIDGDVSTLTGWLLMQAGMVDTQLIPEGFRDASFYLKMNLLDYEKVRKEVERQHGPRYTLEWELYIQSGLPHSVVVDYAHQAIDFGFKKSLVSYTKALPNFLKEHRQQAWVVSGSSYPTVVALAEKLGLTGERVLATKLDLVDGIYMQSFAEPGFVWEKNKVTALESAGVTAPYFVAGDTYGDWYMMEKSTHWVWCVLWKSDHFATRTYRKFLSEKLPFGQEIPEKPGFYVAEWQRKHWVFEVVDE